jgi:fumarylacetoacetate (FAA) hydrolase
MAPGALALAQAASDDFLGPCASLRGLDGTASAQLQPVLAAITGDVAPGADAGAALDGVRLLMVVADWQLPGGSLAAACSPVALTPDELGDAWRAGRVHLRLGAPRHGQPAGPDDIGPALPADLGMLLARAAATRGLRSGGIVGPPLCGDALPWSAQPGDNVRLELFARDGSSPFGAIAQTLAVPEASAP